MLANQRHRLTERSTQRRGVALVMFVMLVFAFMALAAVCIDVGMAGLTQATMQNAVDTAALEGVASRDFFEHRPGANLFRRPLVTDVVRTVFDDDLTPTALDSDEDHREYSAGPIFHLEGGMDSPANASATIVVPDPGDYTTAADRYIDDPVLQINRGHFGVMADLPEGDMVAGTFQAFASHREEPLTYRRADFVPASDTVPYPQAESWKALSFLVRMRRTPLFDDPADLNNPDSNPLVSSSGRPIPFLFGLGSTIHAADGGEYDPRRDGMTVRATAIATGVPVLSIGVLPFAEDCSTPIIKRWSSVTFTRFMRGTGAIALRKDVWMHQLNDFTDDTVDDDGTGPNTTFQTIKLDEATGELTCEVEPGVFVSAGRLYLGTSTGCQYGDMTEVGQALDGPYQSGWPIRMREWVQWINTPPPGGNLTGLGKCYVPLYVTIDGVDRIVGFGHATFRFKDGTDPADTVEFLIQKGFPDGDEGSIGSDPVCAVVIVPENASATLTRVAPNLTADEWELVFRHLFNLTYVAFPEPPLEPPADWVPSFDWRDFRNGALLAPALVR